MFEFKDVFGVEAGERANRRYSVKSNRIEINMMTPNHLEEEIRVGFFGMNYLFLRGSDKQTRVEVWEEDTLLYSDNRMLSLFVNDVNEDPRAGRVMPGVSPGGGQVKLLGRETWLKPNRMYTLVFWTSVPAEVHERQPFTIHYLGKDTHNEVEFIPVVDRAVPMTFGEVSGYFVPDTD